MKKKQMMHFNSNDIFAFYSIYIVYLSIQQTKERIQYLYKRLSRFYFYPRTCPTIDLLNNGHSVSISIQSLIIAI